MSCEIESYAEVRNKKSGVWEKVYDKFSLTDYDKERLKRDKCDNPFYRQSYSMFGFLADVRNYDMCEPLSKPRGIPKDCNIDIYTDYKWQMEGSCIVHSASYFTLRELAEFDYDKKFWNRRIDGSPMLMAEEGEGEIISYRDNLPEIFFTHLEELKELGDLDDVRVIFWFDN